MEFDCTRLTHQLGLQLMHLLEQPLWQLHHQVPSGLHLSHLQQVRSHCTKTVTEHLCSCEIIAYNQAIVKDIAHIITYATKRYIPALLASFAPSEAASLAAVAPVEAALLAAAAPSEATFLAAAAPSETVSLVASESAAARTISV